MMDLHGLLPRLVEDYKTVEQKRTRLAQQISTLKRNSQSILSMLEAQESSGESLSLETCTLSEYPREDLISDLLKNQADRKDSLVQWNHVDYFEQVNPNGSQSDCNEWCWKGDTVLEHIEAMLKTARRLQTEEMKLEVILDEDYASNLQSQKMKQFLDQAKLFVDDPSNVDVFLFLLNCLREDDFFSISNDDIRVGVEVTRCLATGSP